MKVSSSRAVAIVLIGAVFATSGYSQPLEDCAIQTSELQRIQGENAALQTQFGDCTSTVATLRNENSGCNTQLTDFQTQNAALLLERTTQQAEIATIQNQLSSVQQENANLQAQNAALQNDNSGLQSQLQASQTQLADSQAQVSALQAELAQVRLSIASHNWVLGGPGQSCDTVCAARGGGQCNASLTSTINTASAIQTVYKLLTGSECSQTQVGTVFGNEPAINPQSNECIAASPGGPQPRQCSVGFGSERNICCCGTNCPTSFL